MQLYTFSHHTGEGKIHTGIQSEFPQQNGKQQIPWNTEPLGGHIVNRVVIIRHLFGKTAGLKTGETYAILAPGTKGI
jgi:hypothetical protein